MRIINIINIIYYKYNSISIRFSKNILIILELNILLFNILFNLLLNKNIFFIYIIFFLLVLIDICEIISKRYVRKNFRKRVRRYGR